jgi:hypothetical protein
MSLRLEVRSLPRSRHSDCKKLEQRLRIAIGHAHDDEEF